MWAEDETFGVGDTSEVVRSAQAEEIRLDVELRDYVAASYRKAGLQIEL